jgi:hypothetical protein
MENRWHRSGTQIWSEKWLELAKAEGIESPENCKG